jgi:hypothetical protein
MPSVWRLNLCVTAPATVLSTLSFHLVETLYILRHIWRNWLFLGRPLPVAECWKIEFVRSLEPISRKLKFSVWDPSEHTPLFSGLSDIQINSSPFSGSLLYGDHNPKITFSYPRVLIKRYCVKNPEIDSFKITMLSHTNETGKKYFRKSWWLTHLVLSGCTHTGNSQKFYICQCTVPLEVDAKTEHKTIPNIVVEKMRRECARATYSADS